MKRLFLLLIIAAICAGHAVPQSGRRISTPRTTPVAPVQPSLNPEPEAPPTKPIPSTLAFLPESLLERRIRTLDNSSFRLADFPGRVLVINLWASWCGPCRGEVPEYERVRRDYLEREVEFIALTSENPAESTQKVNKFVRDTGFSFRLGWADAEMARTLANGRRVIPQTIVIDANGRVVNHWTGYARGQSGSRLREAIENALK